jgi:predicted DNA-binding protein (MmcQ/YjbR family)
MALSGAQRSKARLARICNALPETGQRPGGERGRHIAYTVRTRTFAYFTEDHHGDGRLALTCKCPPGEQPVLTASDPDRFFVPPYLGHRGWIGVWLDRPGVDWDEVAELLVEAYRLSAPKRLVARIR